MAKLRMTQRTRQVLRFFLDNPDREFYGLEVCAAIGAASGTLHPTLARLEGQNWLTSRWEDLDAGEEGRPRRRYYRLVPDNAAVARAALERAEARLRRTRREARVLRPAQFMP